MIASIWWVSCLIFTFYGVQSQQYPQPKQQQIRRRVSKELAKELAKDLGKQNHVEILGLDMKSSAIEDEASSLAFKSNMNGNFNFLDDFLTHMGDEVGEDEDELMFEHHELGDITVNIEEEMLSGISPFNFSTKIEAIQTEMDILSHPSTVGATNEAFSRICEITSSQDFVPDLDDFVDVEEESPFVSDLSGWVQSNKNNPDINMLKASTTSTTLGVYYYPWYASDFHGGNYLRKHLLPKQTPLLGEYNDRDCEVIAQHLIWSRYAKINLWVTSWWGPGRDTDETTLNSILKNPMLGNMEIAIHYETKGRTKFNSTSEPFTSLHKIGPDIAYLAQNYFDHPNYHRINDRPVIVMYLARVLAKDNLLHNVTDIMRSTAAEYGHDLYIIGDFCFGKAREHKFSGMEYLDAITNYDAYGSIKSTGYVGSEKIYDYFQEQDYWRQEAKRQSIDYIPVVTPGYNDRAAREGHLPTSRKLRPQDDFGSLFVVMLSKALLTSEVATGNMILINSFNEWHEDTQIEPVAPALPTNMHAGMFASLSPEDREFTADYTEGLEYEGYGTRYLDILNNMVN